jgi:LPXTG-motif cell wall-anchored protein
VVEPPNPPPTIDDGDNLGDGGNPLGNKNLYDDPEIIPDDGDNLDDGGNPLGNKNLYDDPNNNPGKNSPKTGDEMNTDFYIAMLALGGIMAAGATIYLIYCAIPKKH